MTAGAYTRRIRLRIAQTAPVLGDLDANLSRLSDLAAAAADDGVDLLVTPELSLTGYDVRDLVHDLAIDPGDPRLRPLSRGVDAVVGVIERGADFVPYNTAAHLRAGSVLHAHRKVHLPTYGMFEEGRYFGRGSTVRAYDAGGGWRMGMLVCEDLWHPSMAYLLAADGANLIVAHSAGSGRGAWAGGAKGRYASWDAWEHIARAVAIAHGAYVVLANRAGVEGPVVFCGGSMVIGPDGSVVAQAADDGEDVITAELDLERVAAARRPFAHIRDEDPHLVMRELTRIVGGGR